MGDDDNSHYFYRGAKDENCVAKASSLFKNLTTSTSTRGEFYTDNETFIAIHNHMKSSTCWKSVSQWESGIEYTIQHPQSDIIVSDTNRGQRTLVYREYVLQTVRGTTASRYTSFVIKKVRRDVLDYTSRSYHDSTYKSVKITSEKIFVYESEKSSWRFHLAVVWQGSTKKEAEEVPRQFLVSVSMGSMEKASADPVYTTASFLEKMMDAIFHKSRTRRHIILCF